MSLRLSALVLALLLPTLAHADDHNADQYAAFSSGGGGSTLFGYRHAFALESPRPSNRNLGFVLADVSVQSGSQVTQVAFMAGPRVTIAKRVHPHKPLLQALVGGVYTNSAVAGTTDTDFAIALGAGYEFIRNEESKWGFRILVDRIRRFGDADDWLTRGSAGVVYRWL
jgi:hypothetical protein